MATRKAAGTAKNLRDSNPKYLGVKRSDGQRVSPGVIIVRQRGTRVLPGKNVALGKDHSIYALVAGTVAFSSRRKRSFDGTVTVRKTVSVF